MRFYIGKFKGIKLYLTLFPDKGIDGSPSMAHHTFNAKNGISKIIINYRVLLLPKIFRQTMLFHEYGHHMIDISQTFFSDKTAKNQIEAMAHFYACCECKLHFSLWDEMASYSFDKLYFKFKRQSKYKERMDYFENRYKDFANDKLREEELDIDDYVYLFYKDTQSLIGMYKFLYEELIDNISIKKDMKEVEMLYSTGRITENEYLYYKTLLSLELFNWETFLIKNGWDNDEERLKYLN